MIMVASAFHCAALQRTVSALVVPTTMRRSSYVHSRDRYQLPHVSRACASFIRSSTSSASEEAVQTTNTNNNAIDEAKLMQDMLYRIRQCNIVPEDLSSRIVDFEVDGGVLGKVDTKVANILCSTKVSIAPDGPPRAVFEMMSSDDGKTSLTLSSEAAGTSVESRTQAVGAAMEELKRTGIVTGWRDELYPISDSFYSPPVFLMERAATALLGVLEYGVHVNGILPSSDNKGTPKMWMGRRSKTKSKYPGMLDHIVAGGQPAGLGLMENVMKECEEEAGIPPELFDRPDVDIRPNGVVSYQETKKGVIGGKDTEEDNSFYQISRVVLFNYDLVLPPDFAPKPLDGEVEEFFLWEIDQIKESMAPDFEDPIKPNCYLVIIDYLLRMGFVSPETKGYLDVLRELKSGDCR